MAEMFQLCFNPKIILQGNSVVYLFNNIILFKSLFPGMSLLGIGIRSAGT